MTYIKLFRDTLISVRINIRRERERERQRERDERERESATCSFLQACSHHVHMYVGQIHISTPGGVPVQELCLFNVRLLTPRSSCSWVGFQSDKKK